MNSNKETDGTLADNDTQSPSMQNDPNCHSTITNDNTQSPQSTRSNRFSAESIVTRSRTTNDTQCPCNNILTSIDSRQCGICGNAINVLDDLYMDLKTDEHEIQTLQQRLLEGQEQIEQRTKDITQLRTTAKQIEHDLDNKTRAFKALQLDMEQLNDKYVDEIDRVAEIQYSKDMVESELEDLSRRLFEEANGMVANEKREKYNLTMNRQHLEKQLEETRDRLAAEQMQLQELRLKMEAMQESVNDENLHGNNKRHSNASVGTEFEGSEVRAINDLAGLFTDQQGDNNPWLGMDTMLLDEFIEFIKLGTTVPLKKLHSIPFMKYCQLEDIDPCLRFGINSRLSGRKMNDAIVMNTCFIEDTPWGFAEEQAKRPVDVPLKISAAKTLIWERFSTNTFAGCQACGRISDTLPYRFRISYFDDWACIDRYCRDRLVAVCEFYVFIRNVRQRYYSTRTVLDLYQEAMRLRLQMFYARIGALPWTARCLGIKDDRIGSATSPTFEIPGPPLSESSPLPRGESPLYHHNKRSGSMDECITKEQPTNDTNSLSTSNHNDNSSVNSTNLHSISDRGNSN